MCDRDSGGTPAGRHPRSPSDLLDHWRISYRRLQEITARSAEQAQPGRRGSNVQLIVEIEQCLRIQFFVHSFIAFHVNGNLAWEIGVETGQAQMKDGTTRKVDWIVTNVYEKLDGQWLMPQ
jgi:hypothetical protein